MLFIFARLVWISKTLILYLHRICTGTNLVISCHVDEIFRFYLRACIELMSKYFEKKDNYIYLYDEVPLFVPNENLEEAEARLRTMKSRYRR